ncbi:MAG: alanyl-tRNA editing protein [Deinococcales bacterium]
MTKKLFWQDPYQTRLNTRVTRLEEGWVYLAETIFYAFSGGQERDKGKIGTYEVLEARKEGLDIAYHLGEQTLQVGEPVLVTIDWPRRYRLMRLHFAAEIILALVYQTLPDIEKIGAHIAEDKARIDFSFDQNLGPYLATFQAEAFKLSQENLPILSAFSDEVTERRYWQIEGFAKVACGGTHLKRTSEVGALKLKRKNVGKAKERIEISLET